MSFFVIEEAHEPKDVYNTTPYGMRNNHRHNVIGDVCDILLTIIVLKA